MALDALSTKGKTEKFVRVVYLFSAGIMTGGLYWKLKPINFGLIFIVAVIV